MISDKNYHTPVLLQEVLEVLQPRAGEQIIDATAGGGGYSEMLLKAGAKVLAIDQDPDAIRHLKEKFDGKYDMVLAQDNFSNIKSIAVEHKFFNIKGIVFDLGTSSHQIKESGRGFSFSKDEDLDMRMSLNNELTAKEIVNKWSEEELTRIFLKYGEEHFAKQIAKEIVMQRKIEKIDTTRELAQIIEKIVPRVSKIHPATRVFQALRIVVNDEMKVLASALSDSFEILSKGGKIVVVSFHSLEDRIVKRYFEEIEREGKAHLIVKRPIMAQALELSVNPRARSAKLRAIEKI